MASKEQTLEKTKSALSEVTTPLLEELRWMIEETRQGVAATVYASLTLLYWRVGKRISEEILKGGRAEYGKEIIVSLARQLEVDYGNSFSAKNIHHMLRFVEAFPDIQVVSTLSRQLSWTHFLSGKMGVSALDTAIHQEVVS